MVDLFFMVLLDLGLVDGELISLIGISSHMEPSKVG